jgi:hypothetical protein
LLLQVTILVALKLTRAKAQNIIFLRASGNTEHFWRGGKLLNRLSAEAEAVEAHAIPRKLYAFVAVRHAHAAPRLNIRGSHHQNRKL